MNMHPNEVLRLAQMHQEDVLRGAEASRLAREVKISRPSLAHLVERVVDKVGTWLVNSGERLAQHSVPPQSGTLREA